MSNGDPLSIAAKAQAMTTPEQQAREMLERMGIQSAYQRMSAGELVELANLIERSDALLAELHTALATINKQSHELSALKAEFKIIDEMNDQLREQNTAVDEACAKLEKENAALKAELAAIKGSGEPVALVGAWLTLPIEGKTKYGINQLRGVDLMPGTWLYTRPCVPLTDEQIYALYSQHALYQEEGYEVSGWRDFARAIEAAHGIEGAKP